MVKLLDILIRGDKDAEEVLLEFELRNPYDFADLEKKLKKVKGITSVKLTGRRHRDMPDAIGYANWNKHEIGNRMNEINRISGVAKISQRALLKP